MKMPSASLPVGPFKGVDLRLNAAASASTTLRRAINVDLTIGGALKRRDGLVKIVDLSSESVGLYSANGSLRTVVPGGRSIQDLQPAEVVYDPIGDGSAFPLGSLSYIHGVEMTSGPSGGQSYPYVVIEKTTGVREHHWLTAAPALSSTAVNTKVILPFDPGKTLVKGVGKLFADDPAFGLLRFSSVVSGPSNWSADRDAGNTAVRQLISGSRDITALSYFKSHIAVMYADAIQLWDMSPDPAKSAIFTTLNGPGTEAPRTPANVLGDMFYFSRGGFRSLSNVISSAFSIGEPREQDIGAMVQDETSSISLTTIRPVALWSQARSQYICAFGTDVWVYTQSVVTDTKGWTKWVLPVSVDYMVEHLGSLYIRSGVTVYKFDPTAVTDNGTTITFDVITAFQNAKAATRKKRWNAIDLVQTGTAQVNFHTDPTSLLTAQLTTGISVTDTTFVGGRIGINTIAENMAFRFTGTGLWRLDGINLDYNMLGGA